MDTGEALRRMLRPAGGGVHVVSTGLAQQRALQRALYGAESDAEIEARWHAALARAATARVAVLGVPSDVGAGFTRGSNAGPAALRAALLARPAHPYHGGDVVDVGDVRVVPQLLTDEMLSEAQRARTRQALYGDAGADLPVSPLDLCGAVWTRLLAANPRLVPVTLGGDHSVAWPAFEATCRAAEARGERVGLLHFDAHTDLLADRLGVPYCFATWAWHANERLGRDGRLVQVGLRISGRTRDHWETTLGVRQYWMEEVTARGLDAVAAEIRERFEARGVTTLYVSNDIDGTDTGYAAATGTPEPGGLTPAFVRGLVAALRARFPLCGGDLVEVAPPLGGDPSEPERTLALACEYLEDLVQ